MNGLSRWSKALVIVAVAVASVLFFFRFQIANGFTVFFGDRYDAMIEVAILQHWANVLHGLEAWNLPRYFYPASDTLGYNDGYVIYGVLYMPLRALGLPIVAAQDAVHAAMKLLGFPGMFLVLRNIGQCRFGWAVFGATLFTIADVTLQHGNHGQLFTLAFVPYAVLFGWRGVLALLAVDRARLISYGAAFLVLYGGWITTAYYLAWFFTLFALIVLAALLVISGRPGRTRIFDAIKVCLPQLIILTILGVLVLLPFLIVYLPKSKETGMHAYATFSSTSFWPLEYINMTSTNVFWGGLFDWIRRVVGPKLPSSHDGIFGFTPLLFGLAIYAALRGRKAGANLVVGAIGIATLISWFLMLRVFGFSAWRLVYAVVPGAAGIRVISRFNLVLLVPAVLLVTVLLDRSRRQGLAIALAALLLIGEVDTKAPVQLDQADQQAMLALVPPLPAACESFYVVSARTQPYVAFDPFNDHSYAHNIDAMVLSEVIGRPTVNGVSTFMPPHWDFDNASAPDYDARVQRYAQQTGIKPPCRLDALHGQYWTTPSS